MSAGARHHEQAGHNRYPCTSLRGIMLVNIVMLGMIEKYQINEQFIVPNASLRGIMLVNIVMIDIKTS